MLKSLGTFATVLLLANAQNALGEEVGPERWQTDKADPNSGITITFSVNNGPTQKYDPTYAWISNNGDGLDGARLAVYCGTFGRKQMIMVWDNQYRSDQQRPVRLSIGEKVFEADAEDISVTFGIGNEFGFEASRDLIRALKSGSEVSYTLAGSDRGVYTLKGSSTAINKALHRCG